MQPPRFEFYDQESPIYTSPRFLPPAKVVRSKINDAIISHGSYLEECTVSNAIVGLRSRIDKHAVIQVRSLPARTTSTCSIVGRAPFNWNRQLCRPAQSCMHTDLLHASQAIDISSLCKAIDMHASMRCRLTAQRRNRAFRASHRT